MKAHLDGVLRSIARNRVSGAAELAHEAIIALESWLRAYPNPSEQQLFDIARRLKNAQPSMAPLARIANEIAVALDAKSPPRALASVLDALRKKLRVAPQRIARRFAAALRRRSKWRLLTYSYSSTVVGAMLRGRARTAWVCCPESRPGLEGRRTARLIARAGIRVQFVTDAGLIARAADADVIVVGADAVTPRGFVNKIGTGALVASALAAGRPVWVLADSTKFLPDALAARVLRFEGAPGGALWPRSPRHVKLLNSLFEFVPYRRGIRVLCESGWLFPAGVRRAAGRIRISKRLTALTGVAD